MQSYRLVVFLASALLIFPAHGQTSDLTWFDSYDWYKDSYLMGWRSQEFDLIYNPGVENAGHGMVRANFLQIGQRFRLHHDWLPNGETDWGPSIRIVREGMWSLDWEPSLVDGRHGFLIRTPYGPMGKWRFDTVKDRRAVAHGLVYGLIVNIGLKGTKPPKGPLAQVAEHVAARTARRFLIGGGNPLLGTVVETVLKRLFRSVGGIFGGLFDGPNTPGLTVSRQTLSDDYLQTLKKRPR